MRTKIGHMVDPLNFKNNLISFSGKKGSGKNFCADILVKEHGFIQMSFAEPLKNIVSIITNTPLEVLEDRTLKEELDPLTLVSRRKIMQWVGTELFRGTFSELVEKESGVKLSLWVELAKNKILSVLEKDPNTKIVFTDARFEDELLILKSLGFTLIYLEREGVCTSDTHASELGVSSDNSLIDHILVSDDTIKDQISSKLNI